MATGNDQITFVNWDYRPAILVGYEAFAVLRRGEPWKKVDRWDVVNSARVMTETAWRRMFVRKFGHLDVVTWRPMAQDNVPQSKPLPRAKDFDDAARAAQEVVAAERGTEQAAKKPGYPSVAALAMGRAHQQLAATTGDMILAQQGKELESLALEAIKKGESHLSQTSLPKPETEPDATPTAEDFDDAARRLYAARSRVETHKILLPRCHGVCFVTHTSTGRQGCRRWAVDAVRGRHRTARTGSDRAVPVAS